MRIIISALVAVLAFCGQALGQSSILQGGAWTPGRSPMYVGPGSSTPVVQDSGPASGGALGLGLAEQLLTVRNPANVYPAANMGTGPFGTNWCDYDAPVTNATGYHVLCLGPNSNGGGMIYYNSGGGASTLPFTFNVNGTSYAFPFVVGGIVGPGSTTVNDFVLWNNATGTLVKDGGAQVGTSQIANNAVTSAQIAAGAVGNTQLAALSVATGNIQANAVGSGQIANGAVGTTQLATGSVTNAILATAPANTYKCNPTGSTAAVQDCTLAQLSGTRTVTGNDTATAADCNKLIIATGGFNTLSLPSAATAGAGCIIAYRNNEVYSGIGTARGKKMSGFPSDFTPDGRNILYPNQTGQVVSDGTNWLTLVQVGRWLLPTTVELCVRQDGDNTSDGLGNGAAASGCLSSIQTAVVTIGEAWDGLGYNGCYVGLYAGGTSTFNEAVAQTGQSIGCYLTFNMRGAIKWTAAGPCLNAGDNSVTIVNWNLGFIPTFKCNTSNTNGYGQFYCHQTCIFDFNGGAAIWIPGGVEGLGTGGTKGTNDVFFYVDLQGSASFNAQVNVGNGTDTFNPLAFVTCETHCSQVTLSGTVASSALVTWQQALIMQIGSVITHTLSWPGATVTSPTKVKGNSVLIASSTVPGGAIVPANGGVVCSSKACP